MTQPTVDLIHPIVKDINADWLCMNDPPRKKAKALNTQVINAGERIAKQHRLNTAEFSCLSTVSQEEQLFLVRVDSCSPSSTIVESTDGKGTKFLLDLSGVESYALYPGKVLVIRGQNTGNKDPPPDLNGIIVALKLYEVTDVPLASNTNKPSSNASSSSQSSQSQSQTKRGPNTKTLICCGPYSTTVNNSPLNDPVISTCEALIELAIKRNSQSVVLCGPFVEDSRTSVCEHTEYAERLSKLIDRIERAVQPYPTLQVVVIPALSDLTAEVLFPQPQHFIECASQIKMYPNPSIFQLNGDVQVGATSLDVLWHMASGEGCYLEYKPDCKETNRVQRIAQQLIRAQSFYPLCPPAREVPLDWSHANKLCFPNGCPDVLILPSKLPPFSKVVDGVLVVNPGKAAMGQKRVAEITVQGGTTPASARANVLFFKSEANGTRWAEVEGPKQTTGA